MTNPLQELSLSELRTLSEALRCGRLAPPFSRVSVVRYCSRGVSDALLLELQKLSGEGVSGEQLGNFLQLLAEERASRLAAEDQIDLVWTGPEAPGVVSRDTGAVIRELFSTARESVLVAGYAVYQGREVFRTLAERMDRYPQLQVRMYLDVQRRYRDTTASSQIVQQFAHRFRSQEWPGGRLPEVYYDPRALDLENEKKSSLHAKCVVIDQRRAFVSSANFTEAAQVRNIEVGVLIRSSHFAQLLEEHFRKLAESGLLQPLPL